MGTWSLYNNGNYIGNIAARSSSDAKRKGADHYGIKIHYAERA